MKNRLQLFAARTVCIFIALCLTVGCGLPTIHYYRVSLSPVAPEVVPDNRPVVMVERFKTQGVLDQDRIVYHNSLYEVGYYNYHRWAAPLDVMVTEAARTYLAGTGQVQVIASNSGRDQKAALILEGEVISFEEVDEGADWFAHVSLMVTLTDAEGKELCSKRLDARRKAQAKSPALVVQALSEALAQCLDEMLEEMKPYLK